MSARDKCDCARRVLFAEGSAVYVQRCGCTGGGFVARVATKVTRDRVEWDEPAEIARCSMMTDVTSYPRGDVHVAGCKVMANLGGPS